jgi:3D (Asp-Asp-Asp) domain-containing protein
MEIVFVNHIDIYMEHDNQADNMVKDALAIVE